MKEIPFSLWESTGARSQRSDLLEGFFASRNVPKIVIGEMIPSMRSWLTDDFSSDLIGRAGPLRWKR